jgi:hypothetical protein
MSISTRRSTLDAATEPSRPAEHAPVRLEPRHIGEKKPPERVDATESSVMEEVEALMLQLAAGDRFERLGAIVQEHLLSGGRKLRARMALAALEAFDVELDRGLAWAGACELLHNASLIHDDLQDRDEVRRGKYCVWVRHGEAQAINAGDLLLMLPFVAVEHVPTDNGTRWELSRALARRAEETVRGQSLEMTLFTSCRWDWASYDDAARGKTSALMSLPVQGAALLAGRDAETAWELSRSASAISACCSRCRTTSSICSARRAGASAAPTCGTARSLRSSSSTCRNTRKTWCGSDRCSGSRATRRPTTTWSTWPGASSKAARSAA